MIKIVIERQRLRYYDQTENLQIDGVGSDSTDDIFFFRDFGGNFRVTLEWSVLKDVSMNTHLCFVFVVSFSNNADEVRMRFVAVDFFVIFFSVKEVTSFVSVSFHESTNAVPLREHENRRFVELAICSFLFHGRKTTTTSPLLIVCKSSCVMFHSHVTHVFHGKLRVTTRLVRSLFRKKERGSRRRTIMKIMRRVWL